MSSCGADLEANNLAGSLSYNLNFPIPTVDFSGAEFQFPNTGDLYAGISKLTNADLTTGVIDGTGTFDQLMRGFTTHLMKEYNASRITGAEYTKAYIALTTAAMGNAVQYLLGRDQAYWAAQLSQTQAITAAVQLESAKIEARAKLIALSMEAENTKANVALTKMKLATESETYCAALYNVTNLLPAQLANTVAQTANTVKNTDIAGYTLNDIMPNQKAKLIAETADVVKGTQVADYNLQQILPAQRDKIFSETALIVKQQDLIDSQISAQLVKTDIDQYNLSDILPTQKTQLTTQTAGQTISNSTATYSLANILPKQADLLEAQVDGQELQNNTQTFNLAEILPQQKLLLVEQTDAAAAQTKDSNPSDASLVEGVLGKQVDLYDQQIVSYKRDSELKAAKVFTDGWTISKTIDELVTIPTTFGATTIDTVLGVIKTNNNL